MEIGSHFYVYENSKHPSNNTSLVSKLSCRNYELNANIKEVGSKDIK